MLQFRLLNVITLVQTQTDNINQMIIITNASYINYYIRQYLKTSFIWSHNPIDNIIIDYIKRVLLY
jgi:hypothetical protein